MQRDSLQVAHLLSSSASYLFCRSAAHRLKIKRKPTGLSKRLPLKRSDHLRLPESMTPERPSNGNTVCGRLSDHHIDRVQPEDVPVEFTGRGAGREIPPRAGAVDADLSPVRQHFHIGLCRIDTSGIRQDIVDQPVGKGSEGCVRIVEDRNKTFDP
jgi:hypothetical protein